MRQRYLNMVECHSAANQVLASGIHAVPDVRTAFATTQAAYRFFQNERVTLRALAEALIEAARWQVDEACDEFVLVAHDWSHLMYPDHSSKKDRMALSSKKEPEGYELQSALLLSDRDGTPLAPVSMGLRAADGVHCSRSWKVREPLSPLDELDPAMSFAEQASLGRPCVHLIDAEADSVAHYRQWVQRPGRSFVVRADDRIVEYEGVESRASQLREKLHREGRFTDTREVKYQNRAAHQWVAEIPIRLTRPAQRNRPKSGDRRRIPGPPVCLRLVIAEIRDDKGRVLATWYLLAHVPESVDAATIALWYYWRWSIETFFKLLKSAGMQVETWQQETASAIAKRLLVASMACVTIWQLARSKHPQADAARHLLVRLSGRQMKRTKPFTMPAMLAGLWILLAMLETLDHYSLDEIRSIATAILPSRAARPPNCKHTCVDTNGQGQWHTS